VLFWKSQVYGHLDLIHYQRDFGGGMKDLAIQQWNIDGVEREKIGEKIKSILCWSMEIFDISC